MPYKDQFRRATGAYLKEKVNVNEITRSCERRWLTKAADLFEGQNPKALTLDRLRWYESQLPDGQTNRANHCYALKRFLLWMGNPAAGQWVIMSRPQRKLDGVFLNESQVAYLRGCVKAAGPVHELMYSLGVDNGLRAVGMSRLTMQNAQDMLGSGVTKIRSKGRNGGKLRVIAMSEMTFQPLTEYLAHRRQLIEQFAPIQTDSLLIYRNRNTGLLNPIYPNKIYQHLKPLFIATGFRALTVHDLRRSFGNRHWRAGTPLETIAEMMGHESVDMTFKAYIGVQLGDMQEAQARLSKMNPCPSVQSP